MTTTTVPTTDLLTDEMLARFDERAPGLRPREPLLPRGLRRAPRARATSTPRCPTEFGGGGLSTSPRCSRLQRRLAYVAPATARRRQHAPLLDRRRRRPVPRRRPVVRLDARAGGRRRGLRRRPRRGRQRPPAAAVDHEGRAGRRRLGDHRPQDLRQPVAGVDLPRPPRAWTRATPTNPQIVHALPRTATRRGYRIEETWDTLGMRATERNDTILDRAFVPDEHDRAGVPGRLRRRRAVPRRASSPGRLLGFAGRLPRASPSGPTTTTVEPHAPAHVDRADPLDGLPPRGAAPGRRDAHRRSRRSTPTSTASCDDWSNGVDHGMDWPVKIVAAKYDVVNRAWQVVDTALDLTGGSGIFKRSRIEQLFRDARLGRIHPGNSLLTHELVGKLEPRHQPRRAAPLGLIRPAPPPGHRAHVRSRRAGAPVRSSTSTNMPSVPASEGSRSAPRPCRRHGAPAASERGEVRAARTPRTRRLRPSPRAERAHRVHEPAARPHGVAAAATSSSRCSAARSRTSLGRHPPARVGPAAQHAEAAARRVEQHTVERLRRAPAVRGRRRRPARSHRERRGDRRRARAVRTRPACTSAATTSPSSRMRSAVARRLAAGRGGDVEHALARLRVEHGDDGLARLVLRRGPAVATARERAEVARVRATTSASGTSVAALDVDAGGAQLGCSTSSAVARIGFDAQRDRRRLVVERERRDRVGAPSVVDEQAHDPVGMRGADADRRRSSSPSGHGHGGPVRASARSTPLTKPRAAFGRRRPTVSPTAACGGIPTSSWYAPRRSAARTSGSSASSGRLRHLGEQEVERALHADRAVDEVGDEARGRAARAVIGAAARGTRMCANAPSSMRTSASSGQPARRTARSTRRSRDRPCRPRAPRGRTAIARLPSGCTSSSCERAVGGADAGRARSTPSARDPFGRGRRARHTFTALPADAEPRAGPRDCRRARCGRARPPARGIEAELVDRELVGVGRLADLRRRGRGRRASGGARRAARVPTSTRRSRSSPAVSCGVDRRRDRTRTPGPVSRPASICMRHDAGLRVAGEDRPLDRRRAAPARQAARSARSRSRAAAPRAARPGAAARTRPPRRARRRSRATSSTISRAFAGVRTGRPSSVAACFTGDGSAARARDRRAVGLGDDERDVVAGRRPARAAAGPRRRACRDRRCARRRSAGVTARAAGRRASCTPMPCSRSSRIALLAVRRGRAGRASARRRGGRSRAGTCGRAARRPRSTTSLPSRSRPCTVTSFGRTISNARPGQREAALFVAPLARRLDDLGVEQHVRAGLVVDVVDEEALLHTDLRRGEADARRVVHRLVHGVDELRRATPSMSSTGAAGRFSTGSPKTRIVCVAIGGMVPVARFEAAPLGGHTAADRRRPGPGRPARRRGSTRLRARRRARPRRRGCTSARPSVGPSTCTPSGPASVAGRDLHARRRRR